MNKEEQVKAVREKIEIAIAGCVSTNMDIIETIDSILSIPNLAIIDPKAKLPEIPDFEYDLGEIRPYLRRGAINYSKMLSGWVKRIGGK
jgi:hypothetical protein